MLDLTLHTAIIQLIIAYTLLGAFVFTVCIVCLSLIGWVRFADPSQQKKLFYVLIVELVLACLGYFTNTINFNPKQVQKEVQAPLAQTVSSLSRTRSELEREKQELSRRSLDTFAGHYRSKIEEVNRAIEDYRKFDTPNMRVEYGARFEEARKERFQGVVAQIDAFVAFVIKWRGVLTALSKLLNGQIDTLSSDAKKGDERKTINDFNIIQRNLESDIDALKTSLNEAVKQ